MEKQNEKINDDVILLLKGVNIEADNKVAVFQNLGEVQIDFIEMGRQCNRIEEIGEQVATQMEALAAAVSALAAAVDSSVSLDGLNNLSSSVKTKVSAVTSVMKSQIKSYQNLNYEIGSKLNELMLIINRLKDGNTTVMYVKDDNKGELMTYNEVYDRLKSGFTPTKYYDITNLAKLIRFYEIGGSPEVVTTNSNGEECYIVGYDTDGKSLTVGPGLQLDANGLSFKPDGTRYVCGDLISKEYIDNFFVQSLATDYRQVVEDALNKDYAHLKLNDAQIDSITSLCYNTSIVHAGKYLQKLSKANENNQSFYDYYTHTLVKADLGRGELEYCEPLAIRRIGESVLFEQGYDAYKVWFKQNYGLPL